MKSINAVKMKEGPVSFVVVRTGSFAKGCVVLFGDERVVFLLFMKGDNNNGTKAIELCKEVSEVRGNAIYVWR
jgi:hypothetical protein